LGIPSIDSFKIVETDASDIGYGGILKQRVSSNSPEQIVRFYSGCTMAPKKDKQKESAKQPKSSQSLRILPPSMSQNKPETPRQLIPYPSCTPISVAPPISVANQFSALVDRIAKYVYNDLPEDPIPRPRQRPTSPADSIRSSLSVEGKSKSELQEIARQLIIQASQMDDDEENDSDKDSPSSPSCQPMQQSPAKPKSWYEDNQDPYDAYDLGSD
ncbi:unnamed protein product, partial [Prunus brigantina]